VRPVTLGASRLRTETAALAAVFTAQVVRQLAGPR
ncbi:MAG: 16S rRNA (uracil(1498)-N(3))-methyltransferase, partial [Hymenobacter sp.]